MRLLNYCSKMIPDCNYHRTLERTWKSAKWQWTDRQQSAFDVIKGILASNPALACFNPNKHSELIVDAIPYGFSGVVIQRSY